MYVKHNARSHHETETVENSAHSKRRLAILYGNSKLNNVSTEIGRDGINLKCHLNEVERFVQVLREVIKRQLKIKLKIITVRQHAYSFFHIIRLCTLGNNLSMKLAHLLVDKHIASFSRYSHNRDRRIVAFQKILCGIYPASISTPLINVFL